MVIKFTCKGQDATHTPHMHTLFISKPCNSKTPPYLSLHNSLHLQQRAGLRFWLPFFLQGLPTSTSAHPYTAPVQDLKLIKTIPAPCEIRHVRAQPKTLFPVPGLASQPFTQKSIPGLPDRLISRAKPRKEVNEIQKGLLTSTNSPGVHLQSFCLPRARCQGTLQNHPP